MKAVLADRPPTHGGGWLFQAPAVTSEKMNATGEPDGDAADSAGDAALVRASLGGDDGTFGELVRRHKSRIFGLATRFTRDAYEW